MRTIWATEVLYKLRNYQGRRRGSVPKITSHSLNYSSSKTFFIVSSQTGGGADKPDIWRINMPFTRVSHGFLTQTISTFASVYKWYLNWIQIRAESICLVSTTQTYVLGYFLRLCDIAVLTWLEEQTQVKLRYFRPRRTIRDFSISVERGRQPRYGSDQPTHPFNGVNIRNELI